MLDENDVPMRWVTITGFPRYLLAECGWVFDKATKKMLKPYMRKSYNTKSGRARVGNFGEVTLFQDGRRRRVMVLTLLDEHFPLDEIRRRRLSGWNGSQSRNSRGMSTVAVRM